VTEGYYQGRVRAPAGINGAMTLYRLIYESKLAPPILGGLLMIGLITVYISVDVLSNLPAGYTSSLELLGQLMLFTLLLPYLLVGVIYAQRYSLKLAHETEEFDEALAHAVSHPPARFLLMGIIAGLLYANLFNVPSSFWSELESPVVLSILLSQNLVWVCIGPAIAIRLHTAMQFNEAGKRVPINIYEQSSLRPFSRNSLVDVLVIMGALSLTALQSIDAQFRYFNYVWSLIVSIPAALTLAVVPMVAIHRRILALRNTEHTAINKIIKDSPRDLATTNIAALELLLQRRERLLALNTWPVDVTIVVRFFLYLVIPPLAWLGAAMVEIALDTAIGG